MIDEEGGTYPSLEGVGKSPETVVGSIVAEPEIEDGLSSP
jgi:hypothetical protein